MFSVRLSLSYKIDSVQYTHSHKSTRKILVKVKWSTLKLFPLRHFGYWDLDLILIPWILAPFLIYFLLFFTFQLQLYII